MKIKLKATDENIQLLKDMVSRNRETALAAREAFAEFVREPILTVIQQASVWGQVFTDLPFDKYSGLRTIPLDLYYDIKQVDYVRVWSTSQAGGLPTQITHGVGEMPFTTYKLDSAISFDNQHLRHARVDYISKALNKMAQEFLVKQEAKRALVVLTALARASTDVYAGFVGGSNPASFKHVIRSYAQDQFNLQDFNSLLTRHKRIMSSFAGGTPDMEQGAGLTDLFVSPEVVEFLRNLAFEPMNLRPGVTDSGGTASTVGIPAPESMREQIYNSAGIPSFYNKVIHEVNELGVGWKWNNVFDTAAGTNDYGNHGDGTSASTFDADDEILVGVNMTREGLLRPVAVDSEIGSTLQTYPDEFHVRSDRQGIWANLEEGAICIDDRVLSGLII